MAYNGRYTSIQRVVEDVFRDAGFDTVDWESAVAWTAQLIGLIGIPGQYITLNTNGKDDNLPPIEIKNYRGKLPSTMVNIISCRRLVLSPDNKIVHYYEMVESTDVYHFTPEDKKPLPNSPVSGIANVVEFELDEDDDLSIEHKTYSYSPEKREDRVFTYKIQGDYIFTNFEEGYVEIAYKSYPIDKNGFPMIPDDEKYIAALQHYIIYKLDWKKWRSNPASPGLRALVNDSEQKADWYIAAAKTKYHIPTPDKMEALKRMWLRSIPKPNEHNTGFKTLNNQERRFNQYLGNKRL